MYYYKVCNVWCHLGFLGTSVRSQALKREVYLGFNIVSTLHIISIFHLISITFLDHLTEVHKAQVATF